MGLFTAGHVRKSIKIIVGIPPLSSIIMQSNITWYWNITALTEAEYKSEPDPTKDISYLALMAELWEFCENIGRKLGYNDIMLHFDFIILCLFRSL